MNFKSKSLSRFKHIIDTESEVVKLISDAKKEAEDIILNAKIESSRLTNEAENLLNRSENEYKYSQIYCDSEKAKTNNEIAEELSNARKESAQMRLKAKEILDGATIQATTIIKNANTKAEEIAGDAYKAKNEAEDLTKTISALRNYN